MGNRPRIFSTNARMASGAFAHSLSIRGWSLGVAKVNALWELQFASGEELSPTLRFGDASRSALMPSILDKAFKGELCPLPILPTNQRADLPFIP
jgi:hypothetical protein